MKLTALQAQCLHYVAQGTHAYRFSRRTFHSLERLQLIEHTSMGWRTTALGDKLNDKTSASAR